MANEKFPRGQLNQEDEGGLEVGFATRDKTVILHFGKPIVWLGLAASDARVWAKKLNDLADQVEAETPH